MKPTLIMMIGLPGSGKSTLARDIANTFKGEIFSSDEIRKEINGSEESQDNTINIFNILHKRIKNSLINHSGEDYCCIYDACNINYKRRMAFLCELKNIDCKKICYFVYTPYKVCLENNLKRERVVPEHAIKRMYCNCYIPQYYEGWDFINTSHKQSLTNSDLNELFYGENGLCKIPHENPHHTLSIGDHCIACYLEVLNRLCGETDNNLCIAALLHDIGKPFTKAFKNSKGETTEIAHYYQHHMVSAYDAVNYLRDFKHDDMLEILALIQWHMFPYFWEKENNEKMRAKYKRLWGEHLYNKVMLLHEADRMAH